MTWTPMATAIETPRLTLRMRDERDAAWYCELVAERGEEVPTLQQATARLAAFRDLTMTLGIGALAIDRRAEGDTCTGQYLAFYAQLNPGIPWDS